MMRQFPPRRIVCLTEETVETLYLLGEQDRIVGVSGYAVRPPQVRREKPRVSAFISADIPKILALEPDLVLAFSDLQALQAFDVARLYTGDLAYVQCVDGGSGGYFMLDKASNMIPDGRSVISARSAHFSRAHPGRWLRIASAP